MVISTLSEATWDSAAYYGLPEGANQVNWFGLVFLGFLAAVMLAIGLVARWRQRRQLRIN